MQIKFTKVSFKQFAKDFNEILNEDEKKRINIRKLYDEIKLPKRSTTGSAGYDFYMPYDCYLSLGNTKILTGIRAVMPQNVVLQLYPRSSLGFKYGFQLINTVGIIDSDYANAENEGHIMAKVHLDVPHQFYKGDKFMQGIFIPYYTTDDDNVTAERVGGIGSTGK